MKLITKDDLLRLNKKAIRNKGRALTDDFFVDQDQPQYVLKQLPPSHFVFRLGWLRVAVGYGDSGDYVFLDVSDRDWRKLNDIPN